MRLTDDELRHIETLARVRLGGESREKLRQQLARIIDFVKQLQGVDTAGHEAQARAGVREPFMRDDAPAACLDRSKVLNGSPCSRDGFFVVPPVIETEES